MTVDPQPENASNNRGDDDQAGKIEDTRADAITRGMAMVRKAVTFTNAQVLDPTANLSGNIQSTGMDVGANALADSAAAMMLQDMRTYLQSTEMVLVPVTAAAFGKILAGETEIGQAALTGIENMLGYLTTFSTNVISNAASIEQDFG